MKRRSFILSGLAALLAAPSGLLARARAALKRYFPPRRRKPVTDETLDKKHELAG